MDDEELVEFRRLAEVAARHSARHLELREEWLADPLRDPRKLRLADAEERLASRALADVGACIERVRRRRLP